MKLAGPIAAVALFFAGVTAGCGGGKASQSLTYGTTTAVPGVGTGGLSGSGTRTPSAVAYGVRRRSAADPLRMPTLQASVVRMGTLHGDPLYGVHLRALVCSRSSANANQTFPTSFRVAHYVLATRATTHWGRPFRILVNDLHWLVPFGEAHGACGYVVLEDVIPRENYAGLESPLGVLGYSTRDHCYGVRLTLRAELESADQKTSTAISATKDSVVLCGRFRPT
jgi:hypothetical protein